MMLVPLLIGAVIHTAAPDAGKFFGSFTGALFTGLPPILGVFYVCLGATLDLKATPYIAKKGGALLGNKIVSAAASPSNEARNDDPALPTSNMRSIVSEGRVEGSRVVYRTGLRGCVQGRRLHLTARRPGCPVRPRWPR